MTREYYKLTNKAMQTRNGFQWEPGVWKRATGRLKGGLCSDAYLHCYDSPLLALLLNPIHANIPENDMRLWDVEVGGRSLEDHGLKFGFRKMRFLTELPVPLVTIDQRVRFGILCVMEVYHEPGWVAWAERWLSGEDRTAESAVRAAEWAVAAWASAKAAAWATAWAAALAAAWATAWAAAEAAALAAEWAAWAEKPLDLVALAEKAIYGEGE